MTTEQLDIAKRAFYDTLLDDPALTLLALSAFDDATATDLPDFTAEPWRPRAVDGTQVLGIRFTRSLTNAADELTVSLGTFHYLEVLTTSKERTEAPLLIGGDNELLIDGSAQLMRLDVDNDVRRQAALWFMTNWQETLRLAFALGAEIDVMTGTFTMDPPSYVQ